MMKQTMFLFLLMEEVVSLERFSAYEGELKLSSVKPLITQSNHNLLYLFSYFQCSNTYVTEIIIHQHSVIYENIPHTYAEWHHQVQRLIEYIIIYTGISHVFIQFGRDLDSPKNPTLALFFQLYPNQLSRMLCPNNQSGLSPYFVAVKTQIATFTAGKFLVISKAKENNATL